MLLPALVLSIGGDGLVQLMLAVHLVELLDSFHPVVHDRVNVFESFTGILAILRAIFSRSTPFLSIELVEGRETVNQDAFSPAIPRIPL